MSNLRVFISYRHEDLGGSAPALVGRMYDRLSARFGEDHVVMDIDTIPPGVDFTHYIGNEVARAEVLLAVMGQQWVDLMDAREGGTDFVRIEIESALERGIPVIPILAGGATMPASSDLPPSLQSFAHRNAFQVDLGRDFNANMDRLVSDMNRYFGTPEEVPAVTPQHASNPSPTESSAAIGERPNQRKKNGAAGIIFTMVFLVGVGIAVFLFFHRQGGPLHLPPDSGAEPHQGAIGTVEEQGREMLMELRNIEANLAELEDVIAKTTDPGEGEALRMEAEELFRARDRLYQELNRLGIEP